MFYYIITFGCETNKSDSERIAAVLRNIGYKKTASFNDADLVIVNACSVRQSAIDRVHGIVRKKSKFQNKKSKINSKLFILTGCVLEEDRNKLKEKFDIILDIRDIQKLPQIIKSLQKTRDKLPNRAHLSDIERWETAADSVNYFKIKPFYESAFRAFVPVMTGCNNFCSYCAVPYTRGKEVSRPAKDIIEEVQNLVRNGYKEITLLGQNVNSYRSKTVNFAKLLRLVNVIPGNFWIRFHSSHPKDFSDELIKAVAECDKVAKYISLPIQSGNDEILKKMNRPYVVAEYKNLVKKIRQIIPDVAISTDFIVGFPGETENQFKDSLKLFKELKFDMAYIASYSPRPGTPAAKNFKDSVSLKEKERRNRILTNALKEVSLAINKKLVGTRQTALVEEIIERKNGKWLIAKTKSFKTIKIPFRSNSCRKLIGNFVNVKIKQALDLGLVGEIV